MTQTVGEELSPGCRQNGLYVCVLQGSPLGDTRFGCGFQSFPFIHLKLSDCFHLVWICFSIQVKHAQWCQVAHLTCRDTQKHMALRMLNMPIDISLHFWPRVERFQLWEEDLFVVWSMRGKNCQAACLICIWRKTIFISLVNSSQHADCHFVK